MQNDGRNASLNRQSSASPRKSSWVLVEQETFSHLEQVTSGLPKGAVGDPAWFGPVVAAALVSANAWLDKIEAQIDGFTSRSRIPTSLPQTAMRERSWLPSPDSSGPFHLPQPWRSYLCAQEVFPHDLHSLGRYQSRNTLSSQRGGTGTSPRWSTPSFRTGEQGV